MTTFVGIDNGVTGSIGIVGGSGAIYMHLPVKKELNYQKAAQWTHRVDVPKLTTILEAVPPRDTIVAIERPMVNPGRFKATASALRCLEAVLIVLEDLHHPYRFIDSKEWQKFMLPKGLEGEELKAASLSVGKRLFPQIEWHGWKDADGLLVAEYLRRTNP